MDGTASPDPVALYLFRFSPLTRLAVVISGAVLVHLSLGTYHTFGNMLPYMASYMRNNTDPNIDHEMLVWIPTFQGCFPFAMVIGGFMDAKLGSRLAASLGCAIMAAGVFLSYWTIKRSFMAFLVTYGMMFGFGQGIAYVLTVTCAINWAPEHVGLVSGIVAAGFGVSSSIFAPIQTIYINPLNHKPTVSGYFTDKDLVARVPSVFYTLALVYGIMQAIGLITVCNPPNPKEQSKALQEQISSSVWPWCEGLVGSERVSLLCSSERYAYSRLQVFTQERCKTDEESLDEMMYSTEQRDSFTPSEMLQSSTFYWLFCALFCCSFYGNMFYNLYKTYGETFIDDDMFMAYAFSTASVFNALARIGWGVLTDRTSFQVSLSSATFLATLLLITMPFTSAGCKWIYFIWMNLMFICLAATHALFITASVKCFGPSHKSTNYGCLILSTTLSAILLAVGCEYLLSVVGYVCSFIITAAFAFTAFLLAITVQWTSQGHLIT